jgi:hypothetical protein
LFQRPCWTQGLSCVSICCDLPLQPQDLWTQKTMTSWGTSLDAECSRSLFCQGKEGLMGYGPISHPKRNPEWWSLSRLTTTQQHLGILLKVTYHSIKHSTK